MKGKAIIQLCDKNGRVIRNLAEENMFTDAIGNILNPTAYTMLHNFSMSSFMSVATPLWEQYLGGIILFSEPLAEDKSQVFLPVDAKPLATAGSPYAGTDVRKGTLNENESGPIENGYRYTWDFATDKANGTIAAVALTSRQFANSGIYTSSSDANGGKLMLNHQSTATIPNAGWYVYGYGQYVGTFEPNSHLFIYEMEDNQIMLSLYRSVDPAAITINDETGCISVMAPYMQQPYSIGLNLRNVAYMFVDNKKGMLYYFLHTADANKEFIEVTVYGIDVHTLAPAEQWYINIPYHDMNEPVYAWYNDCLYQATGTDVIKFDANGITKKKFGIAGASNARFFTIGDRLIVRVGMQFYDITNEDDILRFYGATDMDVCCNVDLKPPYVALSEHRVYSGLGPVYNNRPVTAICGAYLATINNLSEPVVKTSDNVLKVVYEITNE